jgi:hypothetical protein
VIYKAMFDAKSATWKAYGRAVFVEADTEDAAKSLSLVAARADYPASQIEVYAIGESTEAARAAFEEKKARWHAWMTRNRASIPNNRRDL